MQIAAADLQVGSAPARPTVRSASFELFRSLGMTTIFGNPGSTELPMFRDFPADFRYVLALQESVAVSMADGFAQATGKPALVNLHSAAGVGHGLGALFTAFRNRSPLVFVAGQQARSLLSLEPFLYAQQATEFPKPYVKWSCEPARAEDVPAAIARACYLAMQPPCGPTFVSVPVDDWDRFCVPPEPRLISLSIRPELRLLNLLAEALDAASSPAFVVGAAVAQENAFDEVVSLAERHGASVWTTPMCGRNGFPEDHRLFAGFLPARREAVAASLKQADLVVALGAPVFTYHVEGEGPYLPAHCRLFQITDDPIAASLLPSGVSIVSSVKEAALELLMLSRPQKSSLSLGARREPAPLKSGEIFDDEFVMQEIAAVRPADSIIVEEAPSSRMAMQRHLPIGRSSEFYTCSSGGLGYGLPAAAGVSLAREGRRVICILGDGSAMYSVQGLWTAAQLDLPITYVILNNGGYEALREFSHHFEMIETVGCSLPEIDFCGLAAAQGIRALKVESSSALRAALVDSFSSESPTLIEVVLDGGASAPVELIEGEIGSESCPAST